MQTRVPEAIFKMSIAENVENPKLVFSMTQIITVIDL